MRRQNNLIKIIIGLSICILVIIAIFLTNKITKKDIISYEIILIGNDNVEIFENETYSENGFICTDNKNNSCNNLVQISNKINTNVVGNYTVSYQILSPKGEILAEAIRNIKVKENPLKNLELFLVNGNYINTFINELYTEPGYYVIDENNNKIDMPVKIDGYIDTSKVGVYKLNYTITQDDIFKTITREVSVIDLKINSSLDNENYTNKDVTIKLSTSFNDFLYIELPDGSKEYQQSIAYTVSDNGNYDFKIYTKYNNYKLHTVSIDNIDNIKPTISCTLKTETVTAVANDISGISGYSYSFNNNQNYGEYISNNTFKGTNFPHTAFVKVKDKAGNVNEALCKNELTIGPGYQPITYTDSLNYNCIYPYTCFKQLDYNDPYRANETIGTISSSGCMPASLTIIMSGFNIRDKSQQFYTPKTFVNNYLYEGGKIVGHSNNDRIEKTVKDFGLSIVGNYGFNKNMDKLRAHLQNGYPAIVLVSEGCYTGNYHYLTILAINDKDEIFVSDPYSRKLTSYKGCIDNTWIPLATFRSKGGAYNFILIGP